MTSAPGCSYRHDATTLFGGAIHVEKRQSIRQQPWPSQPPARLPVPALAQQDDAEKQFGIVHFETSCNETAQRRFDRAMRYQHSFWYQSSKEIFEETLKADPECGIAYWGIALSLLLNPHAPPPAKNLAEGAAAIAKGKSVGAKTQRERDFIDALAVMYADHEKVPHGARVQAYLKAMEALAARYPNDDEAQIFYGITLNVAASPNDKTYANQLKGAAILEPIFKRQPRHPGVAHYLIHLYDTPALADKGLEAARLYAKIAPGAPHAQHMPSHIFTRVGYWKESIASNREAQRVAKQSNDFHDQLHAMDYQVYAYLQLGQDKAAKAVLDEMTTVAGFTETFLVGPYALAVSPARYAVERGDWKAAAELAGASEPARARAGDDAFRPRARRGTLRQCRRRQGGHRQACRAARQAASPRRTPIGPSRSTSSGRSRPPGRSMPRASTTTRSRP